MIGEVVFNWIRFIWGLSDALQASVCCSVTQTSALCVLFLLADTVLPSSCHHDVPFLALRVPHSLSLSLSLCQVSLQTGCSSDLHRCGPERGRSSPHHQQGQHQSEKTILIQTYWPQQQVWPDTTLNYNNCYCWSYCYTDLVINNIHCCHIAKI